MKLKPKTLCLACLALSHAYVLGQLPSARFDRLYPPSASQGSEVELKIVGTDLEGLKWMKFSHDSLKAEPKKTEEGDVVPNVFVLKVPANAPLGIHKAWIGGGKFGASNYRSFVVSDLPEVDAGAGGTSIEKSFAMELGQTAIGKVTAGKYAWFRFPGVKGKRILVELSTKDIDSKLSPSIAVYDPQGLQIDSDPLGGLLDFTAKSDGNYSVRLNDFIFKGGADYVYRLTVSSRPRIDMVFPPVGKAGTNAKFTIYGRNLPGGQPSQLKTKDGKTLEKKDLNIQLPAGDARANFKLSDYLDPRRAALDHLEYRLKSPAGTSKAAYVGYGFENLVLEGGADNDVPEKAQKISIPCDFVGKFYPASDKDRLRFSAKKGEVYRFEVFSERLGRPSHAFLLLEQLTKKEDEEVGKEIGKSLETASTLGGSIFDVSTRDPSLRFVAPADGDYRVLLYDLFNSSPDPLNVYRLSIRKEVPDFRLAAYGMLPPPASPHSSPVYVKSPTVRKGEAVPVKVMALRRDGFKEAIDLEVSGLPPFVSYSPKRVPEGADSVTVLFQPSSAATDWDGLFSISGKSKVGGKDVRRDCRFADVCWSTYDTSSKIAVSHVQVVHRTPFAVVGREEAPVGVLFDAEKQVEASKKAAEAAVKSLAVADMKLVEARNNVKAPEEARKKADQDLAAKKKELLVKQKAQEELNDIVLKAAKENLEKANAAFSQAEKKRKEAEGKADQIPAADKALADAKSKKEAVAKEVVGLEAEAKKLAAEIAAFPNQVKQAEQKVTAAVTAYEKARSALHVAQANQAGRKADLEAKKTAQAELEKAKANPDAPRVFETSVGGALKLPLKLDSEESFKAQTKIKVFGHKEAPKIKEITVDPKKKNEGVLDVNLATAKIPAGEHTLFCSAQVKGKYKLYSEEEAKKASEEAKKADESLKAAQKVAADAKKALAETKKALDAAKKEKDEAKIAATDKVYKAGEQKQKDADAQVKRLDAKKKAADALAKKLDDAVKKPKDVTVTLFTSPFTLKVRDVPLNVKSLPQQTVKAGEKLNLDVAIERLFGFTDQVSLKVTLPPEAKGVSVKAANVLKDTYGATLEVTTNAASATAGDFECKLEGTLRYNNQNLKFSESFVLKVEPAPEKKSG